MVKGLPLERRIIKRKRRGDSREDPQREAHYSKDYDQKKENEHVYSVDSFNVMFSNTLNFEKVQELRVRIDSKDIKPIIIALCEVKPKNFKYERNLAEYNLDGFDLLPLNIRKEDPGRGIHL